MCGICVCLHHGLLSTGDKTSLPLSLIHTPARTTVCMSRMWVVAVVSAVYQRAGPWTDVMYEPARGRRRYLNGMIYGGRTLNWAEDPRQMGTCVGDVSTVDAHTHTLIHHAFCVAVSNEDNCGVMVRVAWLWLFDMGGCVWATARAHFPGEIVQMRPLERTEKTERSWLHGYNIQYVLSPITMVI